VNISTGKRGSRISSRPRVSHEIIATLRSDIASGRVPRGTRLPNERDMARDFGVSQPTVREAIRALDAMGLVDVKHGSGVYVASNVDEWLADSLETLLQIERVRILDVLDIRAVLGTHSARRAVRNAQPQDLEAIRAALLSIGKQSEVRQLVEAVVRFQVSFAAASNDPLLVALESFLIELIMRFQLVAFSGRGTRFWRAWTARPHPDRERLVELLWKRDEEGTVKAMDDYLHDQRSAFTSNPVLAQVEFAGTHWMAKVGGVRLGKSALVS
jgi:GntR family transcriptional repressor for pyruvate dehydrogenase complex